MPDDRQNQFIRAEVYARQTTTYWHRMPDGTREQRQSKDGWTVDDILDEADRVEENCPHVANPLPAVVVYGVSPSKVKALHAARVEAFRDALGRKIKTTQNTLMVVLASYPKHGQHLELWQTMTVAWLVDRYGDQLLSIVRHDDEGHPHMHAFILPHDLNAKALHPGFAAKAVPGAPRDAYSQATTRWQNVYYYDVGIHVGLTRVGPRRKRHATQAQYHTEKKAADAIAEALRKVDEERAQLEKRKAEVHEEAEAMYAWSQQIIQDAQQQADVVAAREAEVAAREAAVSAREARANAYEKSCRDLGHQAMLDGRAKAAALVDAAELRVAPMRGLGGAIGTMLTEIRGTADRARMEADARVARVKAAAAAEIKRREVAIRSEIEAAFSDRLRQAEAAAAWVPGLEQDLAAVRTELALERSAREQAEDEREDFRVRWVTVDNQLVDLGFGRGEEEGVEFVGLAT